MSEKYGNISDGFFLSDKEVETLRQSKKELTEYGKQKLKQMMNENPTLDEMLEEANRREVANKELEKEEWERKQRSDTVLRRYNAFYNDEVSGLAHGMPTSMEELQCITLQCAIDALICENMNVEYNAIAIDDIKDLIAGLYQQGNDYLERVRTLQEQAQGNSKTDLDAL